MNPFFVISGSSGSGKSMIMKTIEQSININSVTSFTTREPREHEIDGIDYHFITEDEFNKQFDSGAFMEWSRYAGNNSCYGITTHEFYAKLFKAPAYSILDVHGYNQFKMKYRNTIGIFIYNDYDCAMENMKTRGESEENITKRMSTYYWELSNKGTYDYVIKNENGRLNQTIQVISSILSVYS